MGTYYIMAGVFLEIVLGQHILGIETRERLRLSLNLRPDQGTYS